MTNEQIVQRTADYIKEKFADDSTGHDWWHMSRVWRLAKHIAIEEKTADMLVVELAALLHDIADWKFHDHDFDAGPKAARAWLEKLEVEDKTIGHVEEIIRNISFKGAAEKNNLNTLEGQIVHDADKLDAMGAIGIARAFAYNGMTGNPIHDPDIKPNHNGSFEQYGKGKSPAINHFYEKLLLLKDRMYTKTGKQMAQHRHKYMEQYLDEFHKEWQGEI